MALAQDIMKGGFSAGSSKAIGGQVQNTISAAGTTIADATALKFSISIVTTAASGSGVQIPNAEIGDSVDILNLGANAVTVYPPSASSQINSLTAGAGFLLATNTAVTLKKFTSTRWMGFLSA
jgi:hypothetical protein